MLQLADALTGRPRTCHEADFASADDLDHALCAAQQVVVETLAAPDLPREHRARLCAVHLQLGSSRSAVHQVELARRSAALPSVERTMDRLRSASSVAGLLDRAPREIAGAGYARCLVSRVESGRWIAQATHVDGDPELAAAITLAGSRSPRRIDHSVLESELVRTRRPLLVTDAQRNPRVHRELIDVTGTKAYVAAPIKVGPQVIAFVHADESHYTGSADAFDVEVLGLMTEGLGIIAERAFYQERLYAVRSMLVDAVAATVDLVDGMIESNLDALPRPQATPPTNDDRRTARASGPCGADSLTAREREVLELMADGKTNVGIAKALFITEATVKAHVKHIFGKLGVANRAEAVSRYLRP
ncbi:LuxR C-terminal-related transcriptional regulator [Pseudonocardia halophobica]|uniref:LuxR C-terminal-related transcriptional regulator n=1 Tax=Pseudonocardia halophobica TaxID=29401 RepID=UPI003D918F6B